MCDSMRDVGSRADENLRKLLGPYMSTAPSASGWGRRAGHGPSVPMRNSPPVNTRALQHAL
ncbi:hypothetical protein BC834DRAFT_862282 [Gloeopeniophorella convolvens]|nr:hypothetical protein BC834DRAFT_862282 [Gloeopeniophorella convolvens]